MEQATPAIRGLAQRLLALETDWSEQADTGTNATLGVFAKLHSHLTKIIGPAGFAALLSRALALAKTESEWLEAVRVEADATLVGFSAAAQYQPPELAVAGGMALMVQFLSLLVTFIGEALTRRIVEDIWPETHWNDTDLNPKETPA